MKKKLIGLLLLIGLSISLGAYFPVLQGIAWTGMFLRNAHSMPMKMAMADTFDGRHPCNVCRQLRRVFQEKHNEVTKRIVLRSEKLISLPVIGRSEIFSTARSIINLTWPLRLESMKLSPPVPPPRSLS